MAQYKFIEYLRHRINRSEKIGEKMAAVMEVVEQDWNQLETMGSCGEIITHIKGRLMKRYHYLLADLGSNYRVYCKRHGYEPEESYVEKIRMGNNKNK